MPNNTQALPETPWDAFAAPTAPPPAQALPETPWEYHADIAPAPQTAPPVDPSTGTVALSPQQTFQQDQSYPADATVPVEQKLAQNAVTAGSGVSAGALAGNVIAKAASTIPSVKALFEVPESLKSAGINAQTIEHMAPDGQNPADYTNAVQKQLQNNDALGTSAKETWDKMNALKNEAGKNIGDVLQKIKQASTSISNKFSGVEDPTVVDSQPVLQPIADQIQKLQGGVYSGTQASATPFQQAYQGLMNIAQGQGGKLTLDNIDPILKETGAMMDKGEEARSLYGPVYGKLADVRDAMVNTIAQQAKDPEMAQTLLKNNADYSTYMRLLPSVEKAGYREAIKEGVSAYQKYIGPLGEKMAIAGGSYALVRELIDKLTGSH